jgi:thymidylate synthase (FAD)
MIELLSHSQLNQALIHLHAISDLARLFQSDGTDADTLFEYAARVCYRSTDKLGDAPNFIAKRIEEGHEDVIEHATFTFRMPAGMAIPLPFINKHITVSPLWGDGKNGETVVERDEAHQYLDLNSDWVVSGNARVWLHLFRKGVALEVLPYLKTLAPKTFAEFEDGKLYQLLYRPLPLAFHVESAPPQNVVLLSANLVSKATPAIKFKHGAATFLIEHVSRTLTHQLVRHRLGSFSQESQRYVDLSKGGWQPIIPPAIVAHLTALNKTVKFFQIAEETYAELRQDGIRKEDARFLLPGATESRLVMSMDYAGWDNFFWQRLPRAAQWEIRELAQTLHATLSVLAPDVFKEREVYEKGQPT